MRAVLWAHQLPDTPVAAAFAEGRGVLISADGTALAVDLATGAVLARNVFEAGALGAALDPAGRFAVVYGPFGSWLWEIGGERIVPLSTGWAAAAVWANTERAAVATDREVLVADRSGTVIWRSAPLPSTVTALTWLGSWRKLAVAAYGGVWIVEPRRGGEARLSAFKGSLLSMTAMPNGRWIVSGNQDATLQVFRSDNDTRLEMPGFPSKITKVAFDSQGRFLANNGAPDLTVWDFADPGPRGRAPAMLTAPGALDQDAAEAAQPPRIADFRWHPAAYDLAVAWTDGTVARYDVARAASGSASSAIGCVCTLDREPVTLAWPSAGRLVVGTDDGTVAAFASAVQTG